MWPFKKRKKRLVEKVLVGLIIGGAIGSIVGKKMMDKHETDEDEDTKEKK